DLTGELRRQLKPLGRQAEVARRAAGVQADLRDSRLRLLADDLVVLADQIAKETADEQQALDHRAAVQEALAAATASSEAASTDLAAATPALQHAQDTWFALSALAERVRGTVSLAEERARNLSAPMETHRPGRDPDELDASAAAAEAEQAERALAVEGARATLSQAVAERSGAEEALRAAEAEVLRATRAVADRREGLARLSGQVNAARSRAAAADEEVTRLSAAVKDARRRTAGAEAEFADLQESVGDLDSSEVGLDETHESAASAAQAAAERVTELSEQMRAAQTEQAGLRARLEALSLGLDRRDGVGALLAAGSAVVGVLGSIATVLDVR